MTVDTRAGAIEDLQRKLRAAESELSRLRNDKLGLEARVSVLQGQNENLAAMVVERDETIKGLGVGA